ncbi:4'-phosphopantetheinyl transferase superfamily [Ceratobasidium sp. AG-Ba]|nr:4'-phosphopantetheinyl transferase superfamily [Ceratobasidium sp. AG-Ba]
MREVYIVCIDWKGRDIGPKNLLDLMSVLPLDVQDRLKKFYHAEDSWRSLLGHLLPRYWLTQKAVSLGQVKFGKTEYGKPMITSSPTPLSYNVTHDSDMVAIACEAGNPIGVDVMKVALPRNTKMHEFVEFVSDQLSAREKQILQPSSGDEPSRLLWLYRMWTVKEAYTKALGEGVGYDFARIEYDVLNQTVKVDGRVPLGWDIVSFLVPYQADTYVVSVACQTGGDEWCMSHLDSPPEGLVKFVDVEALAKEFTPC